MGWIDSKREKKQRSYCRQGERWRNWSHTKTMSGSAIAATCQSSRGSVNNGSFATQKRKRRLPWCVIILSVFFPGIGRRFMLNGWRISAIGALADKYGGDTGYPHGTGNLKFQIPNPKSE